MSSSKSSIFLIGLQLPEITKGIQNMSMWSALKIALLVTLVVILARLVSGLFSSVFTRFISRYITVAQSRPGWRNPIIGAWAGMRGVVSLASASAIPLIMNGKPFPNRNLILFITFVVIIVTLVGQGLTLPWVVRKVKPPGAPGAKNDDQQILEIELDLSKTAFNDLHSNYQDDIKSNILIKNKFEFIRQKVELLNQSNEGDGAREEATQLIDHYRQVMMNVTENERRKLHSYRKMEDFDDDIIRLIENRLDLEEERLQDDVE